jgi:N-acetylglucosamine-6-phosphate deacetylase
MHRDAVQKGAQVVIRNGRALLAHGQLAHADVRIECGTIAEIGLAIPGTPEIDASNALVLPGLIDLHTHGICRESAGAGNLIEGSRIRASFGATTYYPTLFAPPDTLAEQMRRCLRETENLRLTPNVGGFRLESPYLAFPSGGMPGDIAPIAPSLTRMLLEAGGGHVKIWDISPELEGAPSLIEQLSDGGIVCSMAHTQATIEQARAAVDAGVRLVTHLFDTFDLPEMTDPGVYPAGLVDYLLIEDRVACEIIGDGTHVYPMLVEKAIRCKGPMGVVFVTDSNMGAGLPPGRYSLPGDWGEIVVNGSNDGLRLVDRGMELVGSALTPIDAFRNALRLFNKDIPTASRLCSTAPARLMGLNKGEIAVGRDADVIVLDGDLEILYTIVRGNIAYSRGT